MKFKIPVNPLKSSEEYTSKQPEDMSLEELEILLHSQRLLIKLELERLEKKINYSKFIYKIAKEFKIPQKIEAMFNTFMTSYFGEKNNKKKQKSNQN